MKKIDKKTQTIEKKTQKIGKKCKKNRQKSEILLKKVRRIALT